MVIREYEDRDLEEVNEILMEAFNFSKVTNKKDDNIVELVAYTDRVLGYLYIVKVYDIVKDTYHYLIEDVCVSSKFRGMGIGKALMEEAIKRCDNYITLTSRPERVAAHKLYEKLGFVKRNTDVFKKVL